MMRSSSSTQGGSSVFPGMVMTSTCAHHETDREAIPLTSMCGLQLTVREDDVGAASRRKHWSWAEMRPLGPCEARSCSFLLQAPASVERMSSHGIVRAYNRRWRLAQVYDSHAQQHERVKQWDEPRQAV